MPRGLIGMLNVVVAADDDKDLLAALVDGLAVEDTMMVVVEEN